MIDIVILVAALESEEERSKAARIFARYQNAMYWTAYDVLKNCPDAEDAVMKAAENICQHIHDFDHLSPKDTKRKVKIKIRKIFRKERILSYGKVSLVWMKRAAVYAMVAILILLASCVTIKPLREKIANAFVEWYSEYVAVSMESKSLHPVMQMPTYIPQNYHVIQDLELNGNRIIRYSDDEGNLITFTCEPNESTEFYDYEHHTIEEINIDGCEGLFFAGESEPEYNMMTWVERGYIYKLVGCFEKSELVKIVESLKE